MAFKTMPVADWIKVADNPIQRDTEKHAQKARHLLVFHPTHSFVFAAQLPDGKLIKLDGHTRAYNWKHKLVDPPAIVQVGIIAAKDVAEAEQLYKDFDSKEALETLRDKVSGAFKRHKFEPQSPFMQGYSLTSALRIANGVRLGLSVHSAIGGGGRNIESKGEQNEKMRLNRSADVYDLVEEWSYELMALDSYMLPRAAVSSGTVAAYLLSYRRYGFKVTPFWTGVFSDQGAKQNGRMDAIQAVCEMTLARKGRSGSRVGPDVCARALMGVEKFLADQTLTTIPKPMDTKDYLAGHERPSEKLLKAGRDF